MTTHHLKTWPEYFQAVRAGAKTFEARKDDRDFRVGDTLVLHEYVPRLYEYTGEVETRVVSYVLRGTEHVVPGGCILGFSNVATLVTAEPAYQGTFAVKEGT